MSKICQPLSLVSGFIGLNWFGFLHCLIMDNVPNLDFLGHGLSLFWLFVAAYRDKGNTQPFWLILAFYVYGVETNI